MKGKNKSARAKKILALLKKEYPEETIGFSLSNPFETLIATILSAQSTDKQVEKIIPRLFKKFSTPQKMAKANLREIKKIIKPSGYFNQKAKHIKAASKTICEKFEGKVPDSMESLLLLPGVGRKTANIVLSNCFNKTEGIAVDTHVFRLSTRLGLTNAKTPQKAEKELLKIIPKRDWSNVNELFIAHGRKVCTARKPKHEACVLRSLCPFAKNQFEQSGKAD
ncbi:MAG: endonuclease III [Candidatus Diapherotrites archaeon]